MSVERNRLFALWATAETRARVWGGIAAVAVLVAAGNTILAWRILNRPREVIRVASDGIPQLVRLTPDYDEPQDAEIKAFVAAFAAAYGRADSYSLRNDLLYCAERMVPQLRAEFRKATRDLIPAVEGLQRRTYVDPGRLQIEIKDARAFPMPVRVRGIRQVLGAPDAPAEEQPFALSLQLVKATRRETLAGLLVYSISGDIAGDTAGGTAPAR